MREDLPSGTVSFLFTDIEGSTRLLHELGPADYGVALEEHRRVLREACAAHGGVEFGTQGDAVFVAFPTAEGAIEAAAAATEGLARGPIRVRMGVHTGTPRVSEGDYVGVDVHRAARIAASGHGGQVLVSASTRALAGDGFVLVDLGEHRFKDLSAPEHVFQLGEGEFPPLKTLQRSNLPVPSTPFLGRERELGEVVGRLADPGVRLLTLTGPGGTGKTRLALQAAAEVSDGFPDGVFWVALAAMRDPTLVVPAVAQALEVTVRADEEPAASLARVLPGKRVLVVVDNIEHLLPAAAAELAAVVAGCPTLRLLVTSRERLQLQVESVWPVPPLSEKDGERLFVERARALGVEIEVDDAVVELCRRLDELPLALELAAARTVVFSPRQLLDRLGARLDLLKAGRDADPRQLTLRATIDWSYELLDDEEQRAFRALAVFRGGCTYDAAEQICNTELDTLQSLLDKSLLRRRDGADGEPRFWMLETIREFAREHLQQAHELEQLRTRHANWYTSAAAANAHDIHNESLAAKRWAAAELDNLRAALAHLVEERHLEDATRFALTLIQYLRSVGDYRGMRSLATSVLDLGPPVSADLAALQGWAGLALRALGDRAGARAMIETAAATTSQLAGDEEGRARNNVLLGGLLIGEGEIERGSALMEDAIVRERQLGNARNISRALFNYGVALAECGEPARAVPILEEALSVVEGAGIEYGVIITTWGLGLAAQNLGNYEQALTLTAEALPGFAEHGDRGGVGNCLTSTSAALAELSLPREAAVLDAAAAGIRADLGLVYAPNSQRRVEVRRSQLKQALGLEFETLQAQGRQLSDTEAIELALQATDGALAQLRTET